MTDKKKSKPDPDIIPPERNEKTQAKTQSQTIDAQPRRHVTSSLVLAALLLLLLGLVALRFDLVHFPQVDFNLSDEPLAEAPSPDSGAIDPPATQEASAQDLEAETPQAALTAAESTIETQAPPADPVDDARPAATAQSNGTSATAPEGVFRQALLLLRAGEALSSVWADLQAVLPAAALDPLRNDYNQPSSPRDQLMLDIADWWVERAPSETARLETSLPAAIDSLLNMMITVRPHNPGDRVAESFRQLVVRGDIAGALGQWNGLSPADQQALSAWRAAAKTYLARQALIRLIQDQT
jgi:hypothetical protein